MTLIKKFEEIGKSDAASAGGKGASLGEMTGAGIPVPPGFVVTAQAFERFIAETDIDVEIDAVLHSVKPEEIHTVDAASEKIKAMILAAPMPDDIAQEIQKSFHALGAEHVAVRSSATAEDGATAAWAGQLESYLNTTHTELLGNVKRCFASLFTPRAIFYRFEKFGQETHLQKISVAVVVQKMVESEISGIAFSVHPVTQDYNQLIIEAGLGLGEAIVSGQITPDSYVVEKTPRRLLDKNIAVQTRGIYRGGWKNISEEIGAKSALTDEQIFELADLVLKIEAHYGFPVDVEWAYERGKFYIVQSRPITTLAPKNDEGTPEIFLKEGEKIKTDTVSFDGKEWFLYITRNCSFWANYLTVKGNFSHFQAFGINVRFPLLAVVFDSTESHYFAYEPAYTENSDAILHSSLGAGRLKELETAYETLGKELLGSLKKCLADTSVKNWQEFVYQYARYSPGLNVTAILGRVGLEALEARLHTLGVPEEKIPETISCITYPKEHTPLFLSQRDLYLLATKIQAGEIAEAAVTTELEKWLEKNRHIPVNFTSEPWTIEDARKQLEAISVKDPARELKRLDVDHRDRVVRAEKKVKEFNDSRLTELAATIAYATYLNEYRKNIFSQVSLGFRPIFEKVAALGGSSSWRDCFYLTPEEMTELLQGKQVDIEKLKKERQVAAVYSGKNGKVDVLNSEDTSRFAKHLRASGDGDDLAGQMTSVKGYSASGGIVRGPVKIVIDRKDFHKVKAGDILVAIGTSVDFVPIMEKAAAFVTNEGGITSHASIVSREMGKPCVIATKIATKVFKDGDLVEVDADKGVVRILARKGTGK